MNHTRQQGAALITAIFLIVVIAIVAAMVANVAATQQVTSGRALDATRAYYAARTRLERVIDVVAAGTYTADDCPTIPAPSSIDGFTTELELCDETPVSEGGAQYDVFILRVSAYRGDRTSGTLVRRELRAVVTNR